MKKKILAITLCVAMLAIMLVSGTLAYFTDEKEQTNTFTAGSLRITLDEVKVNTTPNADGNLTALASGERTSEEQAYKLFPGMIVDKDPTITLVAGSENAYLASIITATFGEAADLNVLTKNGILDENNMLDLDAILDGSYVGELQLNTEHPLSKNGLTVYGNDAYSVYQKADSANRTFTFYMFFEGAKTAGTEITLFDTMIIPIPAGWNNDDMAAVNGMKIHVAAYGAQAVGFEDCYEAMTSAFPTDFPFAGLE